MPGMELPYPQSICFDLDGTLVDSVADLTVACNLMLEEVGAGPLDESTVRGYIGDGARKLVERALGGIELDIDHALRRFRHHYAAHLLDHTQPYPGVSQTLERLQRMEIPLAVVTNKPHDHAVEIVKGLHLERFFPVVVGARPGIPVKPAPDMLQTALEELGRKAEGSWMVGDSLNDIKVAHAVGCTAIALSYGIGRRADLQAADPAVILDHFPELLDLLERDPSPDPS